MARLFTDQVLNRLELEKKQNLTFMTFHRLSSNNVMHA